MKTISWCLHKIQALMTGMPKDVTSKEDKIKANKVLDDVQEYVDILNKLILNPKFKKNLDQLEKASIEGVRLQAHEIEELLKDLEHMLQVLDLYIKNLREIIVSHPEKWLEKYDMLVLMIYHKFGGEKGALRKEFEIALHTEEELRQLVTSEKHLAELLK